MINNIGRKVGDGSSTLFWRDPYLKGFPFNVRFRQLYEFVEIKLATIAKLHSLVWEVIGEALK